MKTSHLLLACLVLAFAGHGFAQSQTDPEADLFIVNGDYEAKWPTVVGNTYFLMTSTDMIHWTYVPYVNFGTGGFLTQPFSSASNDRKFLKVRTTDVPTTETASIADPDFDGLSNYWELNHTISDPLAWDTDGDGMNDWGEWFIGTSSNDDGGIDINNGPWGDINGNGINNWSEYLAAFDTDDDGTPNGVDNDIDDDGIDNKDDPDMDGDGQDNHLDADIDGDGLLNEVDDDDDSDGISDAGDSDPSGPVPSTHHTIRLNYATEVDGTVSLFRIGDGFVFIAPADDVGFVEVALKRGELYDVDAGVPGSGNTGSSAAALIELNDGPWLPVVDGSVSDSLGPTTFDGVFERMDLMPLEISDLQAVADFTDDRMLHGMPSQETGESDNDYYQREVPDEQVAFIDPHRAQGDSPEMPNLAAKLVNFQGVQVKWRLEVEYPRGNGYWVSYTKAQYKIKDTVMIPKADPSGNPVFTPAMPGNTEWRMFDHADWISEIDDDGFFGGIAKVYVWPTTDTSAPQDPAFTFRIGGKNPDEAKAKAYINSTYPQKDSRLWFAYAIAKSETFTRVREDGEIRYYNQFYTDYKGGPVGDNSEDMGWAAWAKNWPLYNFDRYYNSSIGSRVQNGPGGYGIYQVTGNASNSKAIIPRKLLWNWQDNVGAGLDIIKSKAAWVDGRHPKLTLTYPSAGALPIYPEGYTGPKTPFSSWDAYTITAYNGLFGGGVRKIKLSGYRLRQGSCWLPAGSAWQFKHNSNKYVQKVFNQLEP